MFRNFVPNVGHVSALTKHSGTIGIDEFDEEMIPSLSMPRKSRPIFVIPFVPSSPIREGRSLPHQFFGTGSESSTTLCIGFDRMRHPVPLAMNPVADVEVMAVLLRDVLAAEPNEVIPVAQLELQFPFSSVPLTAPYTAVPVNPAVLSVADHACVNLLDPVVILRLIAPLETDADFQVLFVCHPVGFHDVVETGSINADRFFNEHVAPPFDGGAVTKRVKTGLGGNYDTIARFEASNCVLEGSHPTKDSVVWQVHFAVHPIFGVGTIASDISGSISRNVLEDIGNSDNLDVVADLDTIPNSTATA
jgi:hypothetical protein